MFSRHRQPRHRFLVLGIMRQSVA